jgi:hypothetical protein
MPILAAPNLLEAACDVVIRFKGHGSYKGEPGALRALTKRAPGFSRDEYRTVFDFLFRVYDGAVDAIRRHPAERPEKEDRFAGFEDIDFDACMVELEAIEPGVATKQKRECDGRSKNGARAGLKTERPVSSGYCLARSASMAACGWSVAGPRRRRRASRNR